VLDLYFAQKRFYNPNTRQFITQDPIKDGMNWYVYCEANPLVSVDWLGLAPRTRGEAQRDNRGAVYGPSIPTGGVPQVAIPSSIASTPTSSIRAGIVSGGTVNPGMGSTGVSGSAIINNTDQLGSGFAYGATRPVTDVAAVAVGSAKAVQTHNELYGGSGIDRYHLPSAELYELEAAAISTSLNEVKLFFAGTEPLTAEQQEVFDVGAGTGLLTTTLVGGAAASSLRNRMDAWAVGRANTVCRTGSGWYKSNGDIVWDVPNHGRIPGAEQIVELQPGQRLGRYGEIRTTSNYVTEVGVSPSEVSLPPHTDPNIYTEILVEKPIPNVIQSRALPYGGDLGNRVQYELPETIVILEDRNVISFIK